MICQENSVSCTPEEMHSIFCSLDKDGTGLIDIKEFSANNSNKLVVEAERNTAHKSPSTKRSSNNILPNLCV